MGLFSFFSKNRQGRAAEDSGRFYSKDDDAALGERARSKRASSAGAVAGSTRGRGTGNDPMLPEKKRARRRLVGAIALALAAAVGLPMLLDSEPKPLAGDIAIQIPSKDKAAPLPVPSVPVSGTPASDASAPARDKAVAAEDSVDKGEEVLQAPPPAKRAVAPAVAAARPPSVAELAKPEPKPEHKPEPKPERKPEPKPEHKPDSKAEHKDAAKAEHKPADKAEKAEKADKPVKPKSEDKPAKPHDDVRAMAILEGKAAEKAEKAEKERPAESGSQKFVLQVAALSSQEKAAELQARLRAAGISSHTEKAGELIKVKVGPLSKDEAEKVRAKLGRIGLSGFTTPV
jgi:DedD protein